jgi:hypothetical protein
MERALKDRIAEYVAAIRERRADVVEARYAPAGETDTRNLRNLLELLRTSDYRTTVLEDALDPAPSASGNTASWQFRVRLGWRTSFGAGRQEWVTFRAEFQGAGDQWRMTRCVIVGTPRIG